MSSPSSRSPPDITSSSSILIRDRFKRLYKKYKENSDKVKIATKKNIPKILLLKAIKPFMLQSKILKTTKTIKNVLYPPNYDKISTLTLKPDDVRFDLSKKYVTLHEDKEQLPIINVTNDFLHWFDGKIDKLKEIVNKKNKEDMLSKLPHEMISSIAKKLSPKSRSTLRNTSKTMQKTLPLPYYLRTNHPNFIKAFQEALFKYETIQSEKEILKEYKVEFDEYKEIIRHEEEGDVENDEYPHTYENQYEDDNGVFPKVIGMYFKLLNVSNMNPKYIYDLARVYHYKLSALGYSVDEDELESIDIIVQQELYKIYVLMYLLSSDKEQFVYENLSESFKNVTSILWGGIEFIKKHKIKWGEPLYREYYIEPYISKEKIYECYSYIFDTIKPDTDKSVEHNFKRTKEELASSQNRFITIPSRINSMKALKKHPEGIKNYENCLHNIMTNKASVTNYTVKGKKLNLLSAFGL